MTARNVYTPLADFKAYVTNRGGSIVTDAADDAVIEQLLEQASHYIDSACGRRFYPRVETRNYDLPDQTDQPDSSELYFDDDLLEIITFTNGDSTTIASTEYNLMPKNETPKYGLKMKDSTTVTWETDSDSNWEDVLSVNAFWGFHNRYTTDAWVSAGTLGAAINDTTTLAFTMTAGHGVEVGKIYKIDNEIYIVTTVATNTITPLKRGDNGSTAATHSNGTTVYEWNPMEEVRNATMELANNAYHRRFGQSIRSEETVTAAGIVLTPREVPHLTKEFIKTYGRWV